MIWIFLTVIFLSIVIFQLGAYSVTVTLLKGFLLLLFYLAGGWLLVLAWRKVFPKKA